MAKFYILKRFINFKSIYPKMLGKTDPHKKIWFIWMKSNHSHKLILCACVTNFMSMHKVFYKMGYKAMDRHNIRLKYRVMNVPPTEHLLTIHTDCLQVPLEMRDPNENVVNNVYKFWTVELLMIKFIGQSQRFHFIISSLNF